MQARLLGVRTVEVAADCIRVNIVLSLDVSHRNDEPITGLEEAEYLKKERVQRVVSSVSSKP